MVIRFCAIVVLSGTCSAACGAMIVTDVAQFSFPHTLNTFTTANDGSTFDLTNPTSVTLPADYFELRGFVADRSIRLVRDLSSTFQSALAVGASPSVSFKVVNQELIPSQITPAPGTRAFGAWFVSNETVDPAGPTMTAWNDAGVQIASVRFAGAMVSGRIVGFDTATYGFLGIISDEPIARLEFTGQAYELDDVRISTVPAPSWGGLGLMGMLVATRRRRVVPTRQGQRTR